MEINLRTRCSGVVASPSNIALKINSHLSKKCFLFHQEDWAEINLRIRCSGSVNIALPGRILKINPQPAKAFFLLPQEDCIRCKAYRLQRTTGPRAKDQFSPTDTGLLEIAGELGRRQTYAYDVVGLPHLRTRH